jgi:hypothetical protein
MKQSLTIPKRYRGVMTNEEVVWYPRLLLYVVLLWLVWVVESYDKDLYLRELMYGMVFRKFCAWFLVSYKNVDRVFGKINDEL